MWESGLVTTAHLFPGSEGEEVQLLLHHQTRRRHRPRLSANDDIVEKEHGGKIDVDSEPGVLPNSLLGCRVPRRRSKYWMYQIAFTSSSSMTSPRWRRCSAAFRRDLRAGRFLMEFPPPRCGAGARGGNSRSAADPDPIGHQYARMNGLEMLPMVRAQRPDVPVIMITAYGDAENRRRH